MRSLAVSALLSFALPALAAGTITRKTIQVEGANDDYTSADITVKKGDVVLIGASGTVVTGSWMGPTDPNGHNGRCGESDKDGALMVKVGTSGAMKAGKHLFLIARDHEGELKFKVRDTKYTDNRGAFTVDIIHIPHDAGSVSSAAKLSVDVANDEWTTSGVSVEPGDLLVSLAAVDPAAPVRFRDADAQSPGTPDGIRCFGAAAMRSDNDGALMMKIGSSEYHRAGSVNFRVADKAGEVKFRVRLKRNEGSQGAYRVALIRIPKGEIEVSDGLANADGE